MAIKLRASTPDNTGKGSELTYLEMDTNLESFYFSSSLAGTDLILHTTGSTEHTIDLSGIAGSGPQGAQGDPGPQGTQGTAGTQGIDGVGTQGTQGTTGTGTQGDPGAQGLQGIQGTEGIGTQGDPGAQGDPGPQGLQGIQGTEGIGTQGDPGAQGDPGPQGIQGIEGIGTQGDPGAQGTQGIAGTAAGQGDPGPQGTQGIQGTEGTGLQGTQGITGTGTPGDPGTQGIQGITGIGEQGEPGAQGTQGTQGIQGLEGTGLQGIQGTEGTGIQGIQGSNGTQGITGTSGVTTGRIYYFNKSVIEVAGYSQLGIAPTGGAEVSIPVLSAQNTDTKITEFISDPFDFTIIPGGVQRFELWMTKENQNNHIETYVILKLADNAGSTLATVGTSQAVDVEWNNNNTTPASVTVDITLTTAAVSIGQRMLVEVWSRNNENQDYTTTLYTEGAAHYSYVITTVAAQEGAQGITGAQGTQGTQGIQGIQGVQGLSIQGTQGISGALSTAKTLGSSSETLGDHTDGTVHTVQTTWTRLATNGASFTNASGGTKSYLVVLGLEMTATYTGGSPVPFSLEVKFADTTGAIVYTEWRDTVHISSISETSRRVTKTYVSHIFQLNNTSTFAVWVKGTPYSSEQLYIQYSLLTVTELTGTPVGTLN